MERDSPVTFKYGNLMANDPHVKVGLVLYAKFSTCTVKWDGTKIRKVNNGIHFGLIHSATWFNTEKIFSTEY